MMGQERRNPCGGRVAGDSEGQRKCIFQRAEVPDAIVLAVKAKKQLDQELTQQEDVLAALQRQVDYGDASESDCLEVRGRVVDLWDRLDNYVRRNYRQRLFRERDRSGVCWLGSSGGSVPFPSSRGSAVLLEKRF
ncbi:hypothetical protein NDU88_003125 [Pleurodeles waltl]|uniref:Uncharacterized protein n=1 Tax=Pleurodeles waltl TaxID=8319 RepID=A0AAV7LED5_PLEWA|nr:hypothetical protein NDU88_003125 [Pleurodeles waltl]